MDLNAESAPNRVCLTGKVSRMGRLKYTPSGTAVCDFTVAVPQIYFDKLSVGYFEMMMTGKSAEDKVDQLRIGKKVKLTGSLWARTFRDRQGRFVNETKVLVDKIEEEKHEKI